MGGASGKISRKGISQPIVAIILVIIALVIVGIAAAIMMGFLGTAAVKTDIMVEKLDLVADGRSVVVLRNTGNVRIDSIDEVTLTCGASGSPAAPDTGEFAVPIDPGKTATAIWDTSLIPGETCTLTVKATAANGAVVAASASAVVRP